MIASNAQPSTTASVSAPSGATSVYLAAQDLEFSTGMVNLLRQQPGLSIVGTTDSLEALLADLKIIESDILLLDICLGDGACLEAVQDIQRLRPRMKILVITEGDWQDQQVASILVGTHGFLYKPYKPSELGKAISLLQDGKVFFDSAALSDSLNVPAPNLAAGLRLSEEDCQFLELIRQGLSNADIAEKLQIEIKAVYQRRYRLTSKLQLKSARELVTFAYNAGETLMPSRASQFRRILVVDDDPMVLQSVKFILRSAGHTVETAADAEQALKKIEEDKFDLVVTDLKLPGMQGDELARKIKARDPSQRVILLTAFPPALKPPGCDDMLDKPFSVVLLRKKVAS
jgi:DNA-binding NarL/FixJ family response regulator